MTLLIISLVAGMLTVLAPCILPLLPVIVGRSLTDSTLSKRRLFVVVTSLGLSIILFTLLLKASTLFIDIPQDFWKWFSGGIIFIFGLVSLFPELWEKLSFTATISQKSNAVMTEGFKKDTIWGDIIVGASLGPIFSACSPTYFVILATVLPVSLALGILYLFTFSLGLALSLVVVALLGQKIVNKLGIVSNPRGWFKRTLGLIFIIVAIAIVSGYDKKLQISLLEAGFLDVTKIEQKLLDKDAQKSDVSNIESTEDSLLSVMEKNKKYKIAPELSSIDGYINTDNLPITISEYRGKKVVLLDIWTYSCINCQRTIPYLNSWYKTYEDRGLVIIGLHTPEFTFEKVQQNVEDAVKKFDIKYPVVLDNDFSTWNAYENRYWPRKYLIDIDGFIVYDHAGEGDYDITEKAIQNALFERNARTETNTVIPTTTSTPEGVMTVESGKVGSPEIYFGSSRNEDLANGNAGVSGEQNLTIPQSVQLNNLYLGGNWNMTSEFAENKGDASVTFKYNAKDVYFVGGSKDGVRVEVYKDEVLLKTITVKAEQLYTLIEGESYGEHTLKMKIKGSGLQAFTFTFG
ncbi:MAG: cytochrome c biogenesis protein CcdA [Candidatus Paceibacterota bacterium]